MFGESQISWHLTPFCDPGEPSQREGEEGKRARAVSWPEESEHMSRCMLRATLASLVCPFLERKLSIGSNMWTTEIIMHAL